MASDEFVSLSAILAARSERLHRLPNVVGTAVGNRRRGGVELDEPCVCVFVARKVDASLLSDDELVPRELSVPGVGTCATDVVETGPTRLVQDTTRYRPVVGGSYIVSTGGPGGGTLGAIAFDSYTHEPAWFTARHCVFNASVFTQGAVQVSQPGIDSKGFRTSGDELGAATDDAPMVFGNTGFDWPGYGQHPLNVVDAAKGNFQGLKNPTDVSFSVLDVGPAVYELRSPEVGLAVWKHGTASGVTKGTISYVDATIVDLDYRNGYYASVGGPGSGFIVEPDGASPFVIPGDSGSVVFAQPSEAYPSVVPAVGIMFAQSGNTGWGCAAQGAFSILHLDTVCVGLFKRGVMHAARFHKYWDIATSPLHVATIAYEQWQQFREVRALARSTSEPGRVLFDSLGAGIPHIADAIYQDPIAFGIYVRLLERVALWPTVLDVLETEIDDETVNLFHRFIARLEQRKVPTEAVNEIGEALDAARGQRIAHLLQLDLGN